MDNDIIVGCSLPDNGGFDKKVDYDTLSGLRQELKAYIDEKMSQIIERYGILILLDNDKTDYKKSSVKFHVDLAHYRDFTSE